MKRLGHLLLVLLLLFAFLGVPTLCYVDLRALFQGKVDLVSGASMLIPDQPSGEFHLFLKAEGHRENWENWQIFFRGGDAGVILDDLCCRVMEQDAGAKQFAERLKARLPENQLRLKTENGLLVASRAESGRFDMLALSKEMLEAYQLQGLADEAEILHLCVTSLDPADSHGANRHAADMTEASGVSARTEADANNDPGTLNNAAVSDNATARMNDQKEGTE